MPSVVLNTMVSMWVPVQFEVLKTSRVQLEGLCLQASCKSVSLIAFAVCLAITPNWFEQLLLMRTVKSTLVSLPNCRLAAFANIDIENKLVAMRVANNRLL